MDPPPLKYKVLFPWTVPNLQIALGQNGDLLSSGLECELQYLDLMISIGSNHPAYITEQQDFG